MNIVMLEGRIKQDGSLYNFDKPNVMMNLIAYTFRLIS